MSIEARFRIQRERGFTLDVRLDVPDRGVTAIVGPSGCGKTTLLRAMAGLEPCPGGYLRVGDDVWQDHGFRRPTHRRPLGFVFQETCLFEHLTVRGNLEYGLKRVPAARRQVSFDRAVELLGLRALLHRRTDGLSGGESQRAAIARALLASPKLLLMDEPLAALDLESRGEIIPFLERLHRRLEIPVLYVSHQPDEVARLADHLVLMGHGRIQAAGPLRETLTRVDLPPARGRHSAAVVEARVTGCDEHFQLTRLGFPGGEFILPGKGPAVGETVRLRILSRDVSLSLEPHTDTSILNIFPVTVTELADQPPAQMIVRLDAGGVHLLSRITRKSAVLLNLGPGSRVWAQVKSIALLD
jgi:molybdate transport system ATP-binding protein